MINTDIYQDDDSIWVLADVAGATRESIAVYAEARSVRIAVGYFRLNLDSPIRCHQRERHSSAPDDHRQLDLPVAVCASRAEGLLKEGLLVLRLPKSDEPDGAMVPLDCVALEQGRFEPSLEQYS